MLLYNTLAGIGSLVRRRTMKLVRQRPSRTLYYISMIEPLVDERYYFRRYPKARAEGFSAAEHYVRKGWRLGYDPAPWFSTRGYLDINGDVALVAMPPFAHYAIHGRREGRTIMPTADARPYEDASEAEETELRPISPDLRGLRAREANDWDVHIGRYTARRLQRMERRDAP